MINLRKGLTFSFAFGATLCLGLGLFSAGQARADESYVPRQLVWKGETFGRIFEIVEEFDISMLRYVSATEVFLLDLRSYQNVDSMATLLASQPDAVYCTPNYVLSVPEPVQTSQPFVDMVRSQDFSTQEAVTTLGLNESHGSITGAGVKVAVIDGGIVFGHEVFSGSAVSGYDYVDEGTPAYDNQGGSSSGHGTFVAGIINLVAPDAEIVSYRVLDTAGRGNGFYIAMAIVRAVDEGCKVINLSMVMSDSHYGVRDAIEYAYDNGALVVAAAGNDSSGIERFPANHSLAISVASVDLSLQKSEFSNFGSSVDICAPGSGLYGPYGDTAFAWWEGTSFAAPFISGQAALLYEARAEVTPNIISGIICSSANSLDDLNPTYSGQLGSGLLDPAGGLALSAELICGDANRDGSVSISDVTYLLEYMFGGGSAPDLPVVGDPDGSGSITIADVTYLIARIFSGGLPPVCVF